MIILILYVVFAALSTFALCVAATKIVMWDDCDLPWPVFCGVFWPVAAPIAAAYLAAKWFTGE